MAAEQQWSLFDQPENAYLDLLPTINRQGSGRLPIDERFRQFHADNPHVYADMVKVSRQMKQAGHPKWSTKAAFEVLRWQFFLKTHSVDGYLLDNVYTAPYARLIMKQQPDLAGFFETRKRKAGAEDITDH